MKSQTTNKDEESKNAGTIKFLNPKNNLGKSKGPKVVIGRNIMQDEDLRTQLKLIREDQKNLERSNSCDIDSTNNKIYKSFIQTKYFKKEEQELLINQNKIINNEKKVQIEEIKSFYVRCVLYDKNIDKKSQGKCFIDTNYIFFFRNELKEYIDYFNYSYYTFPLLFICQCKTPSEFGYDSIFCKEILLKDNRHFVIRFENTAQVDQFNNIIEKFVLPKEKQKYFNYAYYFKNIDKNDNVKNLKIYNLIYEFERQKIVFESNKKFRILNNEEFQFCESYPKKLIVPYDMKDEELEECAKYRAKKRIPTLTYRYKNGNCIWRSSQTTSGLINSYNKFDVLLLTKISDKKKLIIFDARPYINAYSNKLIGGGYEDLKNYKGIDIDIIFCGMSNIHGVRNSYYKLLNTVTINANNESDSFKNINNSGWYDAIIILLKSSFRISKSILNNINVLIHCSVGWDRTSQLCAMSQIILDKYYRTLDGFICVIEKDWISFGHQFRYRNGLYPIKEKKNQFSPIFIQWLDSLYQLMDQNYTKFQFNFSLLSFLANEMFSGKYGTFLFNNEKEREQFEEKETLSIWNYIKENEKKFINPFYDPEDEGHLSFNAKNIKLWRDYFSRFEKENVITILEDYNRKLNEEENIIKILTESFVNLKNLDKIKGLDSEAKKLISKYIKKIK